MIPCKDCGNLFSRPVQRGRPAIRCLECREKIQAKYSKSSEPKASTDTPSESYQQDKEVFSSEEEAVKLSEKKADATTIYQFILMVSNMGQAWAGDNEKEALNKFIHYKNASSMGYGQVGFSVVQLNKLNTELNRYEVVEEFDLSKELP